MDLETESRLGVARASGDRWNGYKFPLGVLNVPGLESGDGRNTTELYTLNG